VSAPAGVGELSAGIVEFVPLTGGATPSAVGSIDLDQMLVGLSGVSSTSSVGAITPADVVGLTGVEATTAVGNVSPLAYKDIDITGNTSYTDVNVA
jgi:hypothetical protein